MNDTDRQARAALDQFFTAWNAADIAAIRLTLNYPHVTLGPAGQVVVANEPSEFNTDFDALRAREGWHHSTLDECTVLSATEQKAHCSVVFSRYHDDGAKYGTGAVLYIVTNRDGHWGMQFRSGMFG